MSQNIARHPAGIDCTFSVITPTYNRAGTLPRVHRSLSRQCFRAFEWVVVDDGSSDETASLVASWQAKSWFPIRYFHQENQGKAAAFDRGVAEAWGQFTIPLDSDDACTPDALQCLIDHWNDIPSEQKHHFAGVTSLCISQNLEIVGDCFPNDVIDSDWLEMQYRYKIKGEKWGFHRTEILREHQFPRITGYIPEEIVWNSIARTYRTRFINKPLRIYYFAEPGRTDEIMQNRDPARNARGLVYWHRSNLEHDLKWFLQAPAKFCASAIHFVRFSLHAHLQSASKGMLPTHSWANLLIACMAPLGVIAFVIDRIRRKTLA
ncbi:MAG: glycosyltransferase [Verrucomicrobiota bacterium]